MSSRSALLQRYVDSKGSDNDDDGLSHDYKRRKKKKKKKNSKKQSVLVGKNMVIKDVDEGKYVKPNEEADRLEMVDLGDGPVIVKLDQPIQAEDSDSDFEVARRVRHDSSEDEQDKAHESDSDSDISVPRETSRKRHDSFGSQSSSSDEDMEVPRRPPLETSKRKVEDHAGVQNKEEYIQRLKEKVGEEKTDDSAKKQAELGMNAATVYRDSRGRKLGMLSEFMKTQGELRGKKFAENQLQYEWGTGKVDRDRSKEKAEYFEQVKNENFSRFADDKSLNSDLKNRVRSGDPMAQLLGSSLNNVAEASSDKSGVVAQSKPQYSGPAGRPNRFGVQPGYRWDGIDRGNGFEAKFIKKQNSKKAESEDKYKWSVNGL